MGVGAPPLGQETQGLTGVSSILALEEAGLSIVRNAFWYVGGQPVLLYVATSVWGSNWVSKINVAFWGWGF